MLIITKCSLLSSHKTVNFNRAQALSKKIFTTVNDKFDENVADEESRDVVGHVRRTVGGQQEVDVLL